MCKIMRTYSIKYSVLAILLTTTTFVRAQQNDKSIIEQQIEEQRRQWNNSSNAAGLLLDKPTENSRLEAGYTSTKGNYKQPQIGQQINSVFLHTQGNLYLKKYYLQGHFSYKRNSIQDAEYNASLINPLREMPYIVADTNSSDWLNQHYDLGFKLTSKPIAEKIMLGLNTNYKAQSGAKQRDIRAENYYYELQLDPSIVYSVTPRHHIGANFSYKSFKEESVNANVNTYVNQGYFFLFGLGNAINYVGSGRTMNYEGDAVGVGLQYQFLGDSQLFIAGNYTVQAEDANVSFTNARPVGTIYSKKWDGHVDFQKESDNYSHQVQASFSNAQSNGIEYITQFISGLESEGYYELFKSTRSKYNNTQAQLQYDLFKNSDQSYSWKASFFGAYTKSDSKYLIPASSMNIESIYYGASLGKLFELSENKRSQLAVEAKIGIKDNLAGEYSYSGADAQEVTVTDLEQRKFEYLSSNYTNIEVPITYSQGIRNNSGTQLFIKASGHYITTASRSLTDRKGFKVSLGATF